jgi:hypothetical protein
MSESVVKGAAALVGSHTPDDEEQQASDRDTDEIRALQRARGERHMQQALDRSQRARRELVYALDELGPIMETLGEQTAGRVLYEQIDHFCQQVDDARVRLTEKGGPFVGLLHVEADLVARARKQTTDRDQAPEQATQGLPTDPVLVWSNKHEAWWQPDGKGYSKVLLQAGIYARANAEERSHHVDRVVEPDEVADELWRQRNVPAANAMIVGLGLVTPRAEATKKAHPRAVNMAVGRLYVPLLFFRNDFVVELQRLRELLPLQNVWPLGGWWPARDVSAFLSALQNQNLPSTDGFKSDADCQRWYEVHFAKRCLDDIVTAAVLLQSAEEHREAALRVRAGNPGEAGSATPQATPEGGAQ